MSRTTRQSVGVLAGAGLTGGVVYGIVLDDAGRFGVRWFWRSLIEGGNTSWALRTQTFWIFVVALLIGGLLGLWIATPSRQQPKAVKE